jgi:hypothetical protein
LAENVGMGDAIGALGHGSDRDTEARYEEFLGITTVIASPPMRRLVAVAAADLPGISRRTLICKLKQYRLPETPGRIVA